LRRGGRYASFFRLQHRDANVSNPVLAYTATS
jgi:subfamily B ATP-binding cassette protein MsbA